MTKSVRARSSEQEFDLSRKSRRVMGRFHFAIAFLLTAFTALGVSGQTASPSPSSAIPLAPVVVTGVLPGPALWQVSKDGHVMWVLGITSSLPKGMQWESYKVERLVASSQSVLKPPSMTIGAKVGFWGRLSLIPSLIGWKKLPDGKTLQQVLPPDLYSRWLVQKSKYLGNSRDVDRLRPIFASRKLYSAAMRQSGLTDDQVVEKVIYSAADRSGISTIDTSYVLVLDDPRSAARQFKEMAMDDQQCLNGIFNAIDQDLSQATVRANAWATGDLQALAKVLSTKQQDECFTSLSDTDFARKVGMTDISKRVRQAWVKAAETALARDSQVVALLSMEQILTADGYLSELQSKGYTVQSPESLATLFE